MTVTFHILVHVDTDSLVGRKWNHFPIVFSFLNIFCFKQNKQTIKKGRGEERKIPQVDLSVSYTDTNEKSYVYVLSFFFFPLLACSNASYTWYVELYYFSMSVFTTQN